MITIWIGHDSQFQQNTPAQLESIKLNSSDPFIVKYLYLNSLANILPRPRDPHQSTDSAFTRWLVPYLADYQGWHLYMDSDMMVRKDLNQLLAFKDDTKSLMLVKHEDAHVNNIKFNNRIQTVYDRKNWSSLMLFNAPACKTLTPDYINKASGLDLHQFKWTDDNSIGDIPPEWNYLVGVNKPNLDPAIVHWTLGGPWFPEYNDTEFAEEWRKNNG